MNSKHAKEEPGFVEIIQERFQNDKRFQMIVIIALAAVVLIALVAMIASSGGNKKDEQSTPLYVAEIEGVDTVVTASGDIARNYKLDDKGNILNNKNKKVVKAKEVERAIVIEKVVEIEVEKNSQDNVSFPFNATVNEDGVRFREGAGTSAKIINELKKGTKVIVNGMDGAWYFVTLGEENGYIISDYLTKDNP